MFPADERELANNKFFQAWRDNSIFERILSAPKILTDEFSEKWVNDFRRVVGDGPMTSRYLGQLAEYIENIRKLEGYSNIKKRLLRLDAQLHPTLVEIEFIYFLILTVKPENISLEFTFATGSGKHPEVRVMYDSKPVYFEVTSVEDYEGKNLILKYFNTFTSYQVSLKTLFKIDRQLIFSFYEYPKEATFKRIYNVLNYYANKKQYLFAHKEDDFSVTMEEGKDVVFDLPLDTFENKIKDKIDEKTPKFDEGERNYIIIDVTPTVVNLKLLAEKIGPYFEYSDNKIVWGVLLQNRRWSLEDFNFEYKYEILCQANSLIKGKEPFETICAFIPNSNV